MARVNRSPKVSLRTERAQVTRNRIVAAARRLFAKHGYGATTLTAIAAEAGVAVQTVYAIYASKAGILRALRQTLVQLPEADELYERAVEERDLERKLELFARSVRIRWERGYDIVATNEDAARTDATVKRDVEKVLDVRRRGISRFAHTLGPANAALAAGVLEAVTLPDVYRTLVDRHGWSPDQYEIWLGDLLKQQAKLSRG